MYQVKTITKTELEIFYQNFVGERTFLQSSSFAAYRQACGETVFLQGYFKKNELVAVALIQQLRTKLKSWLHVPHGPLVLAKHHHNFWPWWLRHYAQLGKELKMDLVRVSPLLKTDSPLVKKGGEAIFDKSTNRLNSLFDRKKAKQFFLNNNYKGAATHLVNPERTWILDITKTEEELLAEMKKSTRYEVRKGLKNETNFKVTVNHDLETFWKLHEATVARQGFVPFTRQSTQKELEAFENQAAIITVWHEKNALASGVFLFDDQAGYYHQGASVHSKLPAAHAYIWAAIVEAKKRGCTEFNFWGVCGADETKHPWFGLSKFKRGFGGFEKNYLHVQDYEITWKAKLNRILETWRKKKRGY